MTNPIPIHYQRPPAAVAAEATDEAPLYYIAGSSTANGATPLFSVYELGSGAERRLSDRSYMQDAQKIVLALRTLALYRANRTTPNPPIINVVTGTPAPINQDIEP